MTNRDKNTILMISATLSDMICQKTNDSLCNNTIERIDVGE